ncbi:MAG: SUMF1/EgtB/PvdO family nonheme iron enzyme [Bacteroides sp.]|nr:SUMF1/EgtB/PvdO family nonheme iron enzyme [Ruminococcus flavefaciens]MCM1554163.1 SUMF1/EgtB/PvdO family nonheme iron enzyme [Bacteroides sp.]
MKSNNLAGRVLRALLVFALIGVFSGISYANNIRIIGKPVITNQDTLKKTVLIKFDLAWDNSWKTSKPANYDAAWIFVKCWDGESWNHVYLEEDGKVPGSSKVGDAVNKDVTYYVTDREGKVKNMPMVLEPGYSYAWKKWHLEPTEDSVKCVVGYFLYREQIGAGHVVVPGVTFKWNYGNQGFVDEDDLVVKVFAVEMVYVPAGPYYLGGKGNAAWQTGSFTTNGNTFGTPMVVKSEGAIKVENSADVGTLWAANDYMEAGTIPAAFPKGYNAFYIMKYEMTQEAYCEFLNTLNQGQQDGRTQGRLDLLGVGSFAWGGDVSLGKNHIKVKQAAPVAIFAMDADNDGVFNETDKVKYDSRDSLVRNIDGQDLAVNFVSLYDLLAYAEFAGLRPMTELEFEKACRGPREPVNDEYAWGSVTKVMFAWAWNAVAGQWYNYRNDANLWDQNTGTEKVADRFNAGVGHSHTWANNWWDRWLYYHPSPLRVGIFADSTSTRAASGATFWGVMNMSDNLSEMCISAGYEIGRKFIGVHGSGRLDGNGNAICKEWNITNAAQYYIMKGMSFYYWAGHCRSWGDRTNVEEYCPGCSLIDHDWLYPGMVSSRHRFNHGVDGTLRDYISYGPQRGIRCVRTQNAER